MSLIVREADLGDSRDAAAIVTLLDSYAIEPVGGGEPLSAEAREWVVPKLREHPTTLVLLALADAEPVGIAVCFFGLSTFRARPLLNVHDLAVLPQYRGKGIGRKLLQAAEEHALRRGCCRLTLEVLEQNSSARALYRSFGFGEAIVSRFLVKPLDDRRDG